MRRTNRSFVILMAMCAMLSMPACTAPAGPPARASWTVMVYMSGDNDLEDYIVQDMEEELAATGSSASIQVIALADRGPGYDTRYGDWQTTRLFHVSRGMTAAPENAIADWGERNFGDPQTLIDFVTWAKSNYPAEHYALYLWGHGWNWHPGYVMQDDTDNDTLDMEEVEAALPSLGFIDMVGFDGCNMASIEVQLLWHGHATALAHSQEWVGGEGVQYDLVLAQLAASPNMSADELAIVTSQSASEDLTWSAVAVDSRLDALIAAVDRWSLALKDGLPRHRTEYDQAFAATQSFWQAPMDRDLYDMAYEIHRLVDDPAIKGTSQAVMDAVEAVVLHERHVNAYADAHGITIYHISRAAQKEDDHRYYASLDFAQQTGWDEFLEAYAR